MGAQHLTLIVGAERAGGNKEILLGSVKMIIVVDTERLDLPVLVDTDGIEHRGVDIELKILSELSDEVYERIYMTICRT